MLRKQFLLKSIAVLAAICIAAPAVQAEIVTKPVAPGVPYRLVFVTNATTTAQSSNIDDYNTFVRNAAAAIPELDALTDPWGNKVTWTAMISTAAVDAIDNTGTTGNGTDDDVAIFNLSGSLVANNNADLWNGGIQNPINRTETDAVISQNVWTGSFADGTEYIVGGSAAAGKFNVEFGESGSTNLAWMQKAATGNDRQYHVYAISSVVPEPSTLIMWTVLAGIGLAVLRRKRAAA